MHYTVTALPGDGIGPEVTAATQAIIDASGVDIRWVDKMAGSTAVDNGLAPLPQDTVDSIKANRVALKGPLGTPVGHGFSSVNVALRRALNTYVSQRPVRSRPGIPTRHSNVDLVIFRENTEGLYAGREHKVIDGVFEALKIITADASRRIAKYAFDYAKWNGRSKVSIVHKAAVMPESDGLFLDQCRLIAADYPFIETEEVPIDRLAMNLVLDPTRYDVLLMENLYGDIVSDLCAGLVGGLGIVPGANIGDTCAVFEAVHGTAPDIAGQGKANPIALTLSGVMMLRHIGERTAAQRIENAIDKVMLQGVVRTGDLGGNASTEDVAEAIIQAMASEV